MAKYRRGLGKGKGKGWKNLANDDPRRHGLSAKGVKTAVLSPRLRKRVRANPRLKGMSFQQLQKQGVFLRYQGDADHDGVVNIRDCKPLDRTKQDDMPVTEIDEFTKRLEKPTFSERLKGLGTKSWNYVKELNKKHREEKEKFQQELPNLSNNQLRELAIRFRDTSLFGVSNPYEEELLRRVREQKKLDKKLKEAKSAEKSSSGLFDF